MLGLFVRLGNLGDFCLPTVLGPPIHPRDRFGDSSLFFTLIARLHVGDFDWLTKVIWSFLGLVPGISAVTGALMLRRQLTAVQGAIAALNGGKTVASRRNVNSPNGTRVTVTAEVAGSSTVVPAILFKQLRRHTRVLGRDLGRNRPPTPSEGVSSAFRFASSLTRQADGLWATFSAGMAVPPSVRPNQT